MSHKRSSTNTLLAICTKFQQTQSKRRRSLRLLGVVAAAAVANNFIFTSSVRAQAVTYSFTTHNKSSFYGEATDNSFSTGGWANDGATVVTSQAIGQVLSVPGFSETVNTSGGTYSERFVMYGYNPGEPWSGGGSGSVGGMGTSSVSDSWIGGTSSLTGTFGAPSHYMEGDNVYVDVSAFAIENYFVDAPGMNATFTFNGDFGVDTGYTVTDYFGNTNSSSGNYADAAHWAAGSTSGYSAPNGVDAVATFSAISSPYTVNLPSGGLTVGVLAIDSVSAYNLAGSGTLTFQASSGAAQVVVSQGTHLITAPIALNSDINFSISPGAQLNLTSDLSICGVNAFVGGGGNLSTGNLTLTSNATLSINGSTLSASSLSIENGSAATLVGMDDGSGASLAVSGSVVLGAGVATAGLASFTQNGGTHSISGDLTIGQVSHPGQYSLNSGVLAVAGTISIAANGAFQYSGGTITGNLTNAGTFSAITPVTVASSILYTNTGGTFTAPSLTNNGTFNYSGGSITVTIINNGTFYAAGGSTRTITGDFNSSSGSMFNSSAGTPVAVTGTLISAGSAIVDSLSAGSLIVNAGTFKIRDQSTADNVSTASSLLMATSSGVPIGTLDLTNNKLIINYGSGSDPQSTVRALLTSAYASGAWTGPGITSSKAAARYGISGPKTTLGYEDDGAGNVDVVYTLGGDANLDGTVNGGDLSILATNLNTYQTSWAAGDFNYDGVVNGGDLAILETNFNKQITAYPDAEIAGSNIDPEFNQLLEFAAEVGDLPQIQAIVDAREAGLPVLSSVVPEPASLSLLLIGAVTLKRRPARG